MDKHWWLCCIIVLCIVIGVCVFILERPKKATIESYEPPKQVIPYKLFQTWHTKNLPPQMLANVNKLKRQNPEFEHFLFDDEESRDFIRLNFDKDVLHAYDKLKPGAYKSDLWRYCVLYIHGGIYMDIKLGCIDDFKLKELIYSEHYVRDRDKYFRKNSVGIYQAFLVAYPKNPLYMDCINQVVRNVKNGEYGFNTLYPTGPGLFGDMYLKNLKGLDLAEMDMRYLGDNKGILYKNKVVINQYPTYRKEQKRHSKTTHYDQMWYDRNIYNN